MNFSNLSFVKTILCFLVFTCFANAEELKHWKLKNGEVIMARYKKYKDGWVLLESANKVEKSIKVSELSIADQISVKRKTGDLRIKIPNRTISDELRKLVPATSQTDLGGRNSCGPNAVANFLLWWDLVGVLPLPYKEKDLREKSIELHDDLERYMKSGNGTNFKEMGVGFKKYLAKHDDFGMNFEMTLVDATMENIKSSPKGSKMTVLSLMTLDRNRPDEGHWVSLIDCSDDGWVTLHTWGWKFVGRLVEGIDKKGAPRIWFEPILDPSSPHYEWLVDGGGFFVEPDSDKIVTIEITGEQ